MAGRLRPCVSQVADGTEPSQAQVDPPDDASVWPWVLKVSWRYSGRKHEGLMLAECRNLGVEGIAECIAHDEGLPAITAHGVLGQQCVSAAAALHLGWRHDRRPLPYSMSIPSSRQKRTKRSQALASGANNTAPTPDHRERSGADAERRARQARGGAPDGDTRDCAPGPHLHARTATTWQANRRLRFTGRTLLAMRDAVRGHRSLLVDGNVLHRDVSVNILITLPSVPRHDGFNGFLLDLDHAAVSDGFGRCGGAGCLCPGGPRAAGSSEET